MHIDPATVTAIMGIWGIGVAAIIQLLKKWLKIGGGLALALTFVVCLGATAFILIQAGMFTWLAFVLYGAAVIGEATGFYHLVGPKPVI